MFCALKGTAKEALGRPGAFARCASVQRGAERKGLRSEYWDFLSIYIVVLFQRNDSAS